MSQEIKKPEKKEFDEKLGYDAETNIKCIAIHNQACDDWKAYHDGFIATLDHVVGNLPSKAEILTMLIIELQHTYENGKTRRETAEKLATAISKRIRGEE